MPFVWLLLFLLKHSLLLAFAFAAFALAAEQFTNEFFHVAVWGCLGYVPGVCWASLKMLTSQHEDL